MERIKLISRLLLALLLLGGLTALPGIAEAGGGCHSAPTEGRGNEVSMVNSCFTPTVLRVKPGTTVTWVNRDSGVHNLVGASNSFGDFQEIQPGQMVIYEFNTAGTFSYQCSLHPRMGGTVVVGDGVLAGAAQISQKQPLSSSGLKSEQTSAAASDQRRRVPIYFAVVLGFFGALIGFALARVTSSPNPTAAVTST